MKAPPTEQRQVVWEVLAQFWVDTWYDAGELDQFAERLAGCGFYFAARSFLRPTWLDLRGRVAQRLSAPDV